MTTINVPERNRAVKDKLEQIYRCSVAVSGGELDLRFVFSHMPIALEHLGKVERMSAVMRHLVPSVFTLAAGVEFTVNISVRKTP